MKHARTQAPGVAPARVRRLRGDGEPRDEDDLVAVEAPIEIRMGAGVSTVLLRTPGDDEDLVRGFLYTEGVVQTLAEIRAIRGLRDPEGDLHGSIVEVDLDVPAGREPAERFLYSSAACGACGKVSLGSLAVRGRRSASQLRITRDLLASLPGRMRDAQKTFGATGGLHASALFTAAGDLLSLREDVGRHNALDKLIGWALAAGRIPVEDCVVVLSGRVSYELMQKSIAAQIPLVAAVGAPSSLAVDLAARFGVTLAGFVRPGSMNVYAGAERIAG